MLPTRSITGWINCHPWPLQLYVPLLTAVINNVVSVCIGVALGKLVIGVSVVDVDVVDSMVVILLLRSSLVQCNWQLGVPYYCS